MTTKAPVECDDMLIVNMYIKHARWVCRVGCECASHKESSNQGKANGEKGPTCMAPVISCSRWWPHVCH